MWFAGDGGNARGPAPNAIMPLEKTAPVAATVVHGPDGYEKLARWVEQVPGPTARLITLTDKPRECGFQQADRITLTCACRCNNSLGDHFAYDLRLAGIVQRFAGSVESFVHRRKRLGVKHPRLDEAID